MATATVYWEIVTVYRAEINLDEHDLVPDDLSEGETLGEKIDDVLAGLEDDDHHWYVNNRIITEVNHDE